MDDAILDYESAVDELLDAFEVHDRLGLARASEQVREEQLQARAVLFNYITGRWQDLKRAGERPEASELYAPTAALRNLAGGLLHNAEAHLRT